MDDPACQDSAALAISREMLAAAVQQLADIDVQKPVLESLLDAHMAVIRDIGAGMGTVTFEEMKFMGKAIWSSTELQQRIAAQRAEILSPVLADRLGTSKTDRRVQYVIKLWSAVLAATYFGVLDRRGNYKPGIELETPTDFHDRLAEAYRIVVGRPTTDRDE
ncbi:hypothetical protein [Mycobacterium sp. 1274761.0]|uniref:hypothetical protein n=1 Tax=Mycobacterium sp. 1274761.0 TaxID=1834077 RepID=UPI0012E81E5F|nr:hypothetical protein [Mycobacterium sp. 1274761.0]